MMTRKNYQYKHWLNVLEMKNEKKKFVTRQGDILIKEIPFWDHYLPQEPIHTNVITRNSNETLNTYNSNIKNNSNFNSSQMTY